MSPSISVVAVAESMLSDQDICLECVVILMEHEGQASLDLQCPVDCGHQAGAHPRAPQLNALIHREQGEYGEKGSVGGGECSRFAQMQRVPTPCR